jgi:hypothetical protein
MAPPAALADAVDPGDMPMLEKVCESFERKTKKQKNPNPKGLLAYAAWEFARLAGWTGYCGKPGPIVILRGHTSSTRSNMDGNSEMGESRSPGGGRVGGFVKQSAGWYQPLRPRDIRNRAP